ncbi:MAG: tetratricopeptide repeat protein [Bacteroidales bacterium]|nr:tetratricopeptide repeat protein [Bacteroidales bacterium]
MRKILCILMALLMAAQAFAQADRHEVRAGNRKFRKGSYKEAEIDYRKALLKDSLSLAGNYNLAGDLYRMERYDEAGKALETIKEIASESENAADYWYNKGAAELQKKNWSEAKKSFRESLLLRPDDMDAKENYSYAKKKEEEQQQQQNQDQDQNNQNKDQQNQDNQQDRNKDQQQNQDQNQDKQDQQQQPQQQPQQDKQELSAQQAQQMLKAVQAKEKETQDKVNEKKAALLESRKKDKNW